MSRDPLDELSSRLFAAARAEQPPENAAQRAAERAWGTTSRRGAADDAGRRAVGWLRPVLYVAIACAGVGLIVARREEPRQVIGAELVRGSARPPANTSAVAPPTSAAAVQAPLVTEPQRVHSAPTTAARPSPVTLADEVRQLKVAESALAASNPAAALVALDRYDHQMKGGSLRAEATLLRIEALARAGQPQVAAALASKFVEQNPTSPLADRAHSFIQQH